MFIADTAVPSVFQLPRLIRLTTSFDSIARPYASKRQNLNHEDSKTRLKSREWDRKSWILDLTTGEVTQRASEAHPPPGFLGALGALGGPFLYN